MIPFKKFTAPSDTKQLSGGLGAGLYEEGCKAGLLRASQGSFGGDGFAHYLHSLCSSSVTVTGGSAVLMN